MTFHPAYRAVLIAALLSWAGCQPKAKEISPLQRKEAASLASEAQFALTIRDYARAEPLLSKAASLCPDTGDYWVSLGSTRKQLGQTKEARNAYESAVTNQQQAYALGGKKDGQILLQEVYVLALLGRVDEAKALLKKAQKDHADNANVRAFTEKSLQQIMDGPDFKSLAL